MGVDRPRKRDYFSRCLFLRQAVSLLTGLTALQGAEEKEGEHGRGEEGVGSTVPGQVPRYPSELSEPSTLAVRSSPWFSVLTLHM